MTRTIPVALALSLWFGSVLSAQQPAPGAIRASMDREAARLASSVADQVPAQQIDKVRSDARVRITASDVEWPGLAGLDSRGLIWFSGSLLASDDDTVTIGRSGGQAVTLPLPGRPIVGSIDRIDGQTLTLTRKRGPAVTVPLDAIARIERTTGKGSRGRSAGLGFLIGAAGGGGVGFVVASGCRPQPGPFGGLSCGIAKVAYPLYLGALSSVAGTVVGAVVGQQRWTTVPLSSVTGLFATP